MCAGAPGGGRAGVWQDRAALEAAFALIREAREWLRAGGELGFGGLADPQAWLEKIEGPGIVLEAKELLDAASLLETAGWLRGQFREEAAKFPLLSCARGFACGFSRCAGGDPAMHPAEWRDQRRCFAGVAAHSREHHADARIDSENAEADFALAQRGGRRRLRHAAQRSLRDSGARGKPAQHAGRGARSERHGADGFSRAARNRGVE